MYIVILAGGSGTRFWPLSRKHRPKQLIPVLGGQTMLQRTVERILPLKPKQILVITNQLQAEETKTQLADYAAKTTIQVIAEPVGRNTAPAIALAASIISTYDPQGIMVVLPADHYIRNNQELCRLLTDAANTASDGWLVTLGIVPTAPETGYGYLEAELAEDMKKPLNVNRFVEKPDLATAITYLDAGNFYWNSGMFVWRCDTILAEIEKHLPQMKVLFSTLHSEIKALSEPGFYQQLADIYNIVENCSIDYGVMEKSEKVKMLAADIGWSDLGSWSALPEVLTTDENNTTATNCAVHLAIESSNCIISGNKDAVATIGVHNLIIVSTDDAVLVCHKERAQDVKFVAEKLEQLGMQQYL